MYFVLSKTAGFLAIPSNLIVLLAVAGAVMMGTRFARAGRGLALTGIGLLAIVGFSPLGNALILPLEQRFPPWSAGRGAPDGVIVLGGAIGPAMSALRGEPSLNESAERMTVVAALARQFPQARIVFSGGDASLWGGPSEAMFVVPMLESFGIPASRIELEGASRNTNENALFTRELVRPKPGERWLLVTSAHHMPRSVGSFRRAGFAVEPYPVDWRTRGPSDLARPFGIAAGGFARTDLAVREWVGLLVYWLTGRSSALFPGP
jgi:uncharacterized SAM-binding protein YcdF (DUF218 family)